MNRREAILNLALLLGSSLAGPRLLAAALDETKKSSHGFGAADLALLDEIGETIIPATHIPGAKAVGIGAFMAMMVHDCYEPKEQAVFRGGLAKLAADFSAQHGGEFAKGAAVQRTEFLNALDREQRAYTAKKTADQPAHYFRIMKDLTLIGYFTSEIGATQALRHVEIPGAYRGSEPYKKGDRAWATN